MLEEVPKESSLLNGKKIIAVGRLHPVKDFETLIYVFDKVVKKKRRYTYYSWWRRRI